MPLQLWLSFIIATLLIDLAPGPSVMLIVSVTIGKDIKEGLKTIAGIITGSALWFSVASMMLLGFYNISDHVLHVLGLGGAVYLLYIGGRSFLPLPDLFSFLDFRKRLAGNKHSASFSAGFMTQLANPKSYLYWLAFLPQFQPASGPTLSHNLTLWAVAMISTVSILVGYVFLAHTARAFFSNKKHEKLLDQAGGVVLIGLGVMGIFRYINSL